MENVHCDRKSLFLPSVPSLVLYSKEARANHYRLLCSLTEKYDA